MIFGTAFGPIKAGTVANIVGTGRDYAIVRNNGKQLYVPNCFLEHEKPRWHDDDDDDDDYLS